MPCRLQTGKNMQEKRCGMTDRGRQSMKKRAGESAAFVRGQEKAPAWDVLQKRRGGVRMRPESRRGNGRTARHSQSVVRTGRRRRETEAALFLSVSGKAQGRVAGERDKTALAGAPERESVRPFGLLRIMSQKGGGYLRKSSLFGVFAAAPGGNAGGGSVVRQRRIRASKLESGASFSRQYRGWAL